MKSLKIDVCTVCLISLVSLASLANFSDADDWPRWMGLKYDGVWHETGMIDKFPEAGPNVLWRQKIGAGYAGSAIVGDHVFVMDRTKDEAGKGIETENNIRAAGQIAGGERVRCLNIKTGEEVWSVQYDCPYKIAYPTGPRCTPTVDGDHVYTLGAMGHLKCLTKDKGDVVWEKLLTKEYSAKPPLWGFASHPYVDREQLIVPVGGEGSGLVSFDKHTGKENWKSVTTNDVGYAPVVIYVPATANGIRQLIFWHGKGISSLNPRDGSELWFLKFPEEPNPSIVTIATPVLIKNKLLIAEYYKGAMMLEVGTNPPSVKEIWRNIKTDPKLEKSMNSMMATPVVKDGFAYGVAYNGKGAGVLRCISLETGEMKWTDDMWMGGDKPLMFSNGFITENEDKYFIFNDIGELMIGKFSPDGFDELDRAKLVEPTSGARGRRVVWSHPAYSSGKVVVRNDEEIICVDLKKH
jgi:outer membrane protein assembly factor BamB